MYEYDAVDYEFRMLQERLEAAGITPDKFDLTYYVGCTYRELKSLVDAVIAKYNSQK